MHQWLRNTKLRKSSYHIRYGTNDSIHIKRLHIKLREVSRRKLKKQAAISKRKAFANQIRITLLIERQNPITRLNRSDRGASELKVALRAGAGSGAGSGMRRAGRTYASATAALRIVGHRGGVGRAGGRGAASRQTEARRVSLASAHAPFTHPYYQILVASTIILLRWHIFFLA